MADYLTTEPLFDWETGDFVIVNGHVRLAIGKERLKSKIHKIIRTQINQYQIYRGTGYGVDLAGVRGKSFSRDYTLSEVKRAITEALMQDESIISVENFRTESEGTVLYIMFDVVTEYGFENIKEEI